MNKTTKLILIFCLLLLFAILSNTYEKKLVPLEPFSVCENCNYQQDKDSCLLCPECGWCQSLGAGGKCVQQDSYGLPMFKENCGNWTPGGYYPYYTPEFNYYSPYYYDTPWYNPWSWFKGWPWKRSGNRRFWRRRQSWI